MSLGSRLPFPLELPPGSSKFELTATPIREGGFRQQVHFYLDDGGLREIIFQVHGKAVADEQE